MSSDPGNVPERSSTGPYPSGRPEELPPVTPPSAGYIIQLFLIPAMIVAAVVAVWALFGKLADSETDWKQMVAELGSSNEHERWRSALGLAQLLRNAELAPVEGEIPLAEQPIIIDGLSSLLTSSLDSSTASEEDVRHQEFLARTLGSLRADGKVLPVLARAVSPQYNSDVRKSALMSIASIAGRHFEAATGYNSRDDLASVAVLKKSDSLPLKEPTINDEETWKQLKLAGQDADPIIRSLAAFAIASVSGPEAMEILNVMLLDSDANTRANAAVGLARNGSSEGFKTLQELLEKSNERFDPATVAALKPEEQRLARNQYEVEQPIIARNCLRALSSLWLQLPATEQQQIRGIVQQLSDRHFAPDVRLQAKELLRTMTVQQ